MNLMESIKFREIAKKSDVEDITRIVEESGFFTQEEIEIAVELIKDFIETGIESYYKFYLAEYEGKVIGYTSFGVIPATELCYDLYWIVVDNEFKNKGLGRRLLKDTENIIKKAGGRKLYSDTSGRDQYKSTRSFYEKCGYIAEAHLKDYYAPNDDKIIYTKNL